MKRLILQKKYKNGKFRDIEKDYRKRQISKEDLYRSKIATSRKGRKYYLRVQGYEDAVDDAYARYIAQNFKRAILGAFAAAEIVAVAAEVNYAQQYWKNWKEEHPKKASVVEVFNGLTAAQIWSIERQIETIERDSGYEFTALTEDEQIEAMVRIQYVLEELGDNQETFFRPYVLKMKDQEALIEIVKMAYEEKLDDSTENKPEEADDPTKDENKLKDLVKMVYEEIGKGKEEDNESGENKYGVRDPCNVWKLNEGTETKTEIESEDTYEIGE